MIKIIAVVYIKLVSICFGINSIATGIYLQVLPPTVKKDPLISEAVQLALIQMLGLVGVAFFTNWKANKIKSEVVAVKEKVVAVETEVSTVKTNVVGVHKEVETLKVNTDGKLSELMDVNKKLSEKLGIEKGIEISKALHDEQSKKDEESNIAKGVLQGKEAAEAKQLIVLPTITDEGATKVEIVQPKNNPVVPVEDATKKPEEKKEDGYKPNDYIVP